VAVQSSAFESERASETEPRGEERLRWTAGQVAEALGVARPSGIAAVAGVAGVSIDSRTIGPGELFVAIHGASHDGHSFVAGALDRGAVAAVVARSRAAEYSNEIAGKLFVVDDTLEGLHRLAARACEIWRKAKPGRRIGGVAGSVGKTTTKEIFAALLASRMRVLKTLGNLNNEYGLPLTLLKLDDEHDAAVIEMGMSHPGELARLTKIAKPDVGVITRIAVEHLEFFASIDEIALAERELIEHLPWPNATAVLNAADERVAKMKEVAHGNVIWFDGTGGARSADDKDAYRAENVEGRGLNGTSFDFVWPQGRKRLDLALIGRHNVMNAVAALAAASVWGIGAEEAAEVFPKLAPADKRGEVVAFEKGFTVINDSYNSSPTALDSVAQLLAATPGFKRRILAAGEMRELGGSSAELHRDCGRVIAGLGKIDWLVGVNGDAAELVRATVDAGFPKERTKFFTDSTEAAGFLAEFVEAGDVLLLKGSRGVKMERILEAIDVAHARVAKMKTPAETAGKKG
jgi:UDP-N-acetylmuramoyl-tripeptide--D-alanyl-D-alanine ligase